MANYATLKAAIQQVVKTNGNNEITGALLQQSLLAMINSLGAYYQYGGIATPETNPGTPDQNVFYLASTAGIYANFGSLSLMENEVAILKYNGTWTKDASGWASANVVKKLSETIAIFDFQMSQFGKATKLVRPSDSWISGTFTSNGGGVANTIYFDPLQFVGPGETLQSVQVLGTSTLTGTISIYLIRASDYAIVGHQDFPFVPGLNTLYPTFDQTLFAEKVYVGFLSDVYVKFRQSESASIKPSYTILTGGTGLTAIGWYLGYACTILAQDRAFTERVETLETKVEEIEESVGSVNTVVLPSSDYIDGSFPVGGAGGNLDWVFFDTQCIVSGSRKLQNLKIYMRYAGTLRISLLAMDKTRVTYKDVSVAVGLNNIDIVFDDSFYTQNMYVGVSTDTDVNFYLRSNSANTTAYRQILSTGQTVKINYDIGYCITVIDKTETIGYLLSQVVVGPDETIDDILAKGLNDIVLGPYDYHISSPIILSSGQTIRGSFGKTRLILTNGCNIAIQASNADDIKISDLEIVGTCPNYSYEMNGIIAGTGYSLVETESDAIALRYMGTERGIYLYHCENVVLENLKINHITGSAIRVDYVGRNYIKGLNANNLFITNCYNGIFCENEHEFSQYTNWTVTLCMIGVYVSSGNLIFTAGHATRCRVAMMFVSGQNNAHGIVNGVELKHNQIAGLLCSNVTNGEFFQGLYVSYSSIISRDCTGLYFDDILCGAAPIDFTGSNGKNMINMLIRRAAGVTIVNSETLTINNNIALY